MATKYLTRDLKQEIDDNRRRIEMVEKNDARQDERIQNIKGDIQAIYDDHKLYEAWRDDVNKILTQSQSAIRIVTWVGAAFGISIIALIWMLITGQASLFFK